MKEKLKFEQFITKHQIHFDKNIIGESAYKTFMNWKKGQTKSPTVQMIMKFFNTYKHEINYDLTGLMQCFYEYEFTDRKKPIVYAITTNNKMYNSFLCNKVIKELSNSSRILVLDENTYSNISYVNEPLEYPDNYKPYEMSRDRYDKLEDKILSTTNNNVDIAYLSRVDSNNYYTDRELYELTRLLRQFILSFKEYDIILFNYWEVSSKYEDVYSRVSDYLFYITNCEDGISDFEYNKLINYNNNLNVFHSKIDYIYRHIKYDNICELDRSVIDSSLGIINQKKNTEHDDIQVISSELIEELEECFRDFSNTLYRI